VSEELLPGRDRNLEWMPWLMSNKERFYWIDWRAKCRFFGLFLGEQGFI
jgi:hypothetical protein